MPRCLTNSTDAHAHTLAPNTPAKVTQAPASKFTHCSQGHTCACVYENSPPGRKQFDTTSISHPSSQALLSFLTTTHFYLFPPLAAYVFALRGLHPFSLFLILSNFSFSSPLVLHSLSLSSVTLPLFSARCDQLGDISPADIPGDRALRRPRSPSSLLLLPPFSFFSPHLAVLSLLLLLISSTFLSSTNNLTRAPPSTNLTPYSADSDIPALLSSVSPLIYPSFFFPLYVPLCPLCTNSIPPRSFFFLLLSPLSISFSPGCHSQ